MNTSCEVIKDLLPLYHDGICRNESKRIIEEHLLECNDCKSELDLMDSEFDITGTSENLSEVKDLKELSRKWRLGKLKSFLTGTLVTFVIIIIIALIIFSFVDIRIA